MKPYRKILAIAICFLLFVAGCTSIRPYQRQYLNDHAMQQGAFSIEKSENEATTYREGAAGGDMGKSGGGCGCN